MKTTPDSVMVTVTLHVVHQPELSGLPQFTGVDKDGYARFRVARARIEAVDAGDRQHQFMEVLASATDVLKQLSLGLTRESDPGVDIHLTLAPHSGQAGIVVPEHVLHDWAEWNPSLYVDALKVGR